MTQRIAQTIWLIVAIAQTALAIAVAITGGGWPENALDALICWYVAYLLWVLNDRETLLRRVGGGCKIVGHSWRVRRDPHSNRSDLFCTACKSTEVRYEW